MNYQKHYYTLIKRAKSRILEGYVEKHHIIPKCLGGTDDMSNLVVLTPEEHFVAHQLLVKMYPQNEKLIFAANMMCVKTPKQKRNNKRYAWLKRKVSESKKGKPSPNKGKKSTKPRKPRAKETKPRKPRKLSEEHKEKIAKSRIGTKRTQETKNLLSISIQKALRKKKEELGYVRTYTPKRKKITP